MSTSTLTLSRPPDHKRLGLGLAYAAFAGLGLVWGLNFIFVKWALPFINPAQIVLLRVLFGFLPLLVVALATRSLHWRDWRHAHHFAVMAVLATAFYYLAFAKGTALLLSSVAGMLSGAIPLFTFVTAWAFLRQEPINIRSIGGTVLGFLGILLTARPWSQSLGAVNVAGVLWMIAGSFSVGCSFVYAKRFISPLGLSPLTLTTYQIGLALLILLAASDLHGVGAVFDDTRRLARSGARAGACAALGWPISPITSSLTGLGAVMASGVTYIPPVVALAVGALLVGEPVKVTDIVAMAAILIGVAVLQSGRKKVGDSKAVQNSKQTVWKVRLSGFRAAVRRSTIGLWRTSRGPDRSQLLLLPEAVDDYVGADNPVRFHRGFCRRAGSCGSRVSPVSCRRGRDVPAMILPIC